MSEENSNNDRWNDMTKKEKVNFFLHLLCFPIVMAISLLCFFIIGNLK